MNGRATASLEFLNQLAEAVIVLGEAGMVLVANRAALELARDDGLLQVGSRGVRLQNREQDAELQAMISGAMQAALGRGSAGGVVRLPGPPARILSVVPLVARDADSARAVARVAIFVRPAMLPAPRAVDLHSLYGLTTSEAQLACRLAKGMTLAAAAEAAGISIHTARAQLKQVFGKTRTHRQTDLLRLLSGLTRNDLRLQEDV